jgi:hypothetical protein
MPRETLSSSSGRRGAFPPRRDEAALKQAMDAIVAQVLPRL